jgi:Domain of Unknown Function (DUF1259)
MNHNRTAIALGLLAATVTLSLSAQPGIAQVVQTQVVPTQVAPAQTGTDWKAVEAALGQTGEFRPGWIFRVSIPRKGVRVHINGQTLKPALAQNSTAIFQNLGNDQAIVNGDLVVTERELPLITLELQRQGLQHTSTNRNLPTGGGQLYWLHYTGRGPTITLAKAVRAVLEKTTARLPVIRPPVVLPVPKGTKPAPTAAPVAFVPRLPGLDTRGIGQLIGASPEIGDGVVVYSFARNERVTWNDLELSSDFGTSSRIAMQPIGFDRAIVTGSLVLTASEVNPITRALSEEGIRVVEVNHELLDESPRLFHLRFYAQDNGYTLAKVLRRTLDKTNTRR